MIPIEPFWILVATGLAAGLLSGVFGIGGGIVIIPALIYLLGFSQHKATGTSLAVLLPPVGLAAFIEYYRNKNVDVKAGVIIALALIVGAWAGARLANRLSGPTLRLAFGAFVTLVGVSLVVSAMRRIGWM